jgi:hypothetical protein
MEEQGQGEAWVVVGGQPLWAERTVWAVGAERARTMERTGKGLERKGHLDHGCTLLTLLKSVSQKKKFPIDATNVRSNKMNCSVAAFLPTLKGGVVKTMQKGREGSAKNCKMASLGGFEIGLTALWKKYCLAKQIKGKINTGCISCGHMNEVTNQTAVICKLWCLKTMWN